MSFESGFPWIEVGAADPKAPQGFVRNRMIHLDELAKWRERYKNEGVYCTAYRYQTKDKTGDLWGHLYFDLDDKEDFERVRQDCLRLLVILEAIFGIQPDEPWLFFSGQKGIHVIIPAIILGIEPHPHLNEIFKHIAVSLSSQIPNKTIDPKVYDRVRLFRLPNSRHQVSKLYKIPISAEELRTLSLEQIRELAREPRRWEKKPARYNTKAAQVYASYVRSWENSKKAQKFSKKRGPMKLDFTPPCVAHLLLNGTVEGKRNETVAVLANHFKQRGYSEEHTMDTLLKWNQKKVSPPLDEKEIATTVRSIFQRDYHYGCTSLERLAPCDPTRCRFGKSKAS